MGLLNILVEGVSGTGKTSVAEELQRRGHHVVHGDRELAQVGDPVTGARLATPTHLTAADRAEWSQRHHIWDEAQLAALIADRRHRATFFCGGSRNFPRFLHLFDHVFVLDVDRATLLRRLARRPPGEFGAAPEELALILRRHASREDIPGTGTTIDATAPVAQVVDDILHHCGL